MKIEILLTGLVVRVIEWVEIQIAATNKSGIEIWDREIGIEKEAETPIGETKIEIAGEEKEIVLAESKADIEIKVEVTETVPEVVVTIETRVEVIEDQ